MPDRSFTGSHPGSPATRPMETGGDSPPSHGGVDERTGTRRESFPEAPMVSPILAASVGSQNSWRSSARIRQPLDDISTSDYLTSGMLTVVGGDFMIDINS